MKRTLKGLAAAVAVATALTVPGCSTSNQQWHTGCKVVAKDILLGSDGDGNTTRTKRLTTSCGSFDVEDTIAGGFNSWDTWQSLEVGKTYDLRTGGQRIGFLSMFPYVLEVKAK